MGHLQRGVGQKGFTLIELMIVVAIIGVLAAISFSSFSSYDCMAKQSEARSNLGAIATSEEAYFCEFDSYGALASLGFSPIGNARYAYSVQLPGGMSFLAAASAVIAGQTDTWTMNQDRAFDHPANACQ